MSSLLKDPMFFYAIAFAVFIGLAFRYGRAPVLQWLDSEILKIRDSLEQARKLRAEAEAMLAEYKAKHAAAMSEADAIVQHAAEEAARMKAQAESDLKEMLARHEKQMQERIRIAETEAEAAVRAATVDMAIAMAHKALASQMDDTTATRLADQSIADLPKRGIKAKAA